MKYNNKQFELSHSIPRAIHNNNSRNICVWNNFKESGDEKVILKWVIEKNVSDKFSKFVKNL